MQKQFMSILFVFLALVLVAPAQAQVRTPSASSGVKVETTVGLTQIGLDYSAPSAKGRDIFGGLVPYGEVWRTGANQAVKITFSDGVIVDGSAVAAGSYAVLTKPGKEAWEVMFFPYESGSWNSYLEKKPAAVAKGIVSKRMPAVETFSITVNNISMEGAHLTMAWANTQVEVPLTVEVKEKVMANIQQVMAGPSSNDYFQAATFMHEAGIDKELALEYVQKANKMLDSPRYWMVRREATLLADLGKKQEALKKAQESLKLAKEAGNMDYVRMNEASIKEWGGR